MQQLMGFLECSDNNKAITVLELFQNAVSEWGLPSRVRCDQGGENTKEARFNVEPPSKRNRKGISDCRQKCPQSGSRMTVARCLPGCVEDVFRYFLS